MNRNKAKKIPWEEIRREYIENELQPTLHELAEKYSCSISTILKRASKENWSEQRKLFLKKVEELRREKKSELLVKEASDFDYRVFELVKRGVELISHKFNSNSEEISAVELQRLSQALRTLQEVGKFVLGEVMPEEVSNKIELIIKDLTKDGD